MQKVLLLAGLLSLTSFAYSQEKVECTSLDGQWQVSLTLTDERAQDISFTRHGNAFKTFASAEVTSTRIFNQRHYEIFLGGSKYLNITRQLKGKVPLDFGSANFLLTNNPFGWERHAEDCRFTSL
jgi:hypothetical protein